MKKINEHLHEQEETGKLQINSIYQELNGINKQIGNIVTAITNGFYQDEFKAKMEDLKDKKLRLETNLREYEVKGEMNGITEEQVKQLFSMFKGFVLERNLPKCKKFIQNYVDKVIIYKDHVEVIFSKIIDLDELILYNISIQKSKSEAQLLP